MPQVKEGILVEFGTQMAPFLRGVNVAKLAVTSFAAIGVMELRKFTQASIKVSKAWERSMAEIQTITGVTKGELKGMEKQIRDLSITWGQDFEKVARARYDVISAGFTGINESMMVMEASAKGAVGGLTDIATAAKATTAVLNAYELGARHAERVNDMLFATVKTGVTTYGELATEIGQVAATAKASGRGLAELFALIATITKGGVSTTEAVTYANQFFLAFLKPGPKAVAVMKEFGITLNQGIGPALEKMAILSEENVTKLAELMPNIRGLLGALTASAEKGHRYAEALESIAMAQGDVTMAANTMQQTLDQADKRMAAQVESLKSTWGDFFNVFKAELVESEGVLFGFFDTFESLINNSTEAWRNFFLALRSGGSLADIDKMTRGLMSPYDSRRESQRGLAARVGPATGLGIMGAVVGPMDQFNLAATTSTTHLEQFGMSAAELAEIMSQYRTKLHQELFGVAAPTTEMLAKDMARQLGPGRAGRDITMEMPGQVTGLRAKQGRDQAAADAAYQDAIRKLELMGNTANIVLGNAINMIQGGIYQGLAQAFGAGESAMGRFAAATLSQLAAMILRATVLKSILSSISVGPLSFLPFEKGGFVPGFQGGGYTGASKGQVAGVVHDREFVLNAEATKAIGAANLERMNRAPQQTISVGDIHINGTPQDAAREIAEEIRAGLPRALRTIQQDGTVRQAFDVDRRRRRL